MSQITVFPLVSYWADLKQVTDSQGVYLSSPSRPACWNTEEVERIESQPGGANRRYLSRSLTHRTGNDLIVCRYDKQTKKMLLRSALLICIALIISEDFG